MVRLSWWSETCKKQPARTLAPSSVSSLTTPPRPPQRPRLSSRDAAVRRPRSRTTSEDYPFSAAAATTTAPAAPVTAAVPLPTTNSPRRRMNSRDIARSYSGLYGFAGDMLPFEMNRQRGSLHTSATTSMLWLVLSYATLVGVLQMTSLLVFSPSLSWTATNALHLLVTLIYIHWLKGSLYDEQGEMNALTVWEQLEATVDTKSVRRLLLVVPTILTYAACHFAAYDPKISLLNASLWMIALLAKLPMMNGVRIFGINRTVGIDDVDDDDDFFLEDTTSSTVSSGASPPQHAAAAGCWDGKEKTQ